MTQVELCLDPSIKIYCDFTVDKGKKNQTQNQQWKLRIIKKQNFVPESREESEAKYYSAKGGETSSYSLSFLPC